MAKNTQRNGKRDGDKKITKGGGSGKPDSQPGSKGGTGTTRLGEEKRGSKDR